MPDQEQKLIQKQGLTYLLLLVLAAITLAAAYWPVLSQGFLLLDDPLFVQENPASASSSLFSAFTQVHAGYWIPLTWIAFSVQHALFESSPGGFHLVSLGLHLVNAGLFYWLLFLGTRSHGKSWFAAALWMALPVNVEAVAWVSAQKELWAVFFALFSLIFYTQYKQRGVKKHRVASLVLFCCSGLAHPLAVSFPLVLFFWDFWPLGKIPRPFEFKNQATEKGPYFILAGLFALFTLAAHSLFGAVEQSLPFWDRLANAFWSIPVYMRNVVWPAGLCVFYPHPGSGLAWYKPLAGLAFTLAMFAGAIHQRKNRPWLLAGWAWFLLFLLPILGLVQAGAQAMADRFAYLPSMGITVLAVWAASNLASGRGLPQKAPAGLGIALIVLSMVQTHQQVGVWNSRQSLWLHAFEHTSNNAYAANRMGRALEDGGNYAGALEWYGRSVRINPRYAAARVNRAGVLLAMKKNREAMAELMAALAIEPRNPDILASLGTAAAASGDLTQAALWWSSALQIAPNHPGARQNLEKAVALINAQKREKENSNGTDGRHP